MIRRLNPLYALLPLTLFLGACTTDSDESVDPVTDPSPGFVATFQPASAQVPFPNDIFFSGTADGTLNIPATGDPSLAALNLLDGYSTTAAIYADTSDAVAGESVIYGMTVFLINTANPLAPVAAQASVADYQNGSTVIEIRPLAPLDAGTTYAAFLTKNIVSTTGDKLSTDADFQALVDLYAAGTPLDTDLGDPTTTALYGAIAPLLQLADAAGIGSSNIAVAWSFKTQTIGASLAAVEAGATAQSSAFVPVPKNGVNYDDGIATTADMDARLAGHADVFVGVIEMPYYSSVESPLTGYWTPATAACEAVVDADDNDALKASPASTTGLCPTPAVKMTLKVPVLLTVPNATSASAGAIAGVTIFQHGITGNRTNMLAIADALADVGQAVVAIDLPLHGLPANHPLYASDASPLYAASGMTGITEATFNLDVDGQAGNDPSGAYFINLENLPTARDNLRQAASNLIYLTKSIPAFDYNIALNPALEGADFGGLPIGFVGQSLGSITGVPYLAVNDNDTCTAAGCPALLSVPGGTVAALLAQSPTFGPVVEDGLAENGIISGTRMFAEFLRNAQTVVDSGDPINYAADAAAAHPIVIQEVIGGAASGPDQVIPNFATDALIDAMGLDQLEPAFHNNTAGVSGVVKFVAGSHSSLLDPTASLAVTTEMQVEAASFIGSQGTQLAVGVSAAGGHPEVIDAP